MTDTPIATPAEAPADAWSMTADQVTTKLAELKAAFDGKPADNAKARLETKLADKSFREAYLSGDGPSVREFEQMQAAANIEADPVAAAMAGTITEIADSALIEMKGTAAALREIGASDAAIRQHLAGEPVTKDEFNQVKEWKASALRDVEWTKRWLAGDAECIKQMTAATIVLTGPVKGDAA